MKQVDFFFWNLTVDGWGRKCKPYASTHRMDAEQALKRDPDATPILGTREVRNCPDDGESTMTPSGQPYDRRS